MDIGARLRTAREALGWSLGSLAQRTRVQPRILEAIERNDLPAIPPKPFGRGFVRCYAREVGLDPEQTVHDYFGQFPPATPQPAAPSTPLYEARPRPWLMPIAGITVLVVLVVSALRGGAPETTTAATTDAVGTSGVGSVEPAPDPAAAQPSTSSSSTRGLDVLMTVNADSWITATADGERVIYSLVAAGSQHKLHASRDVSILAGNAGGIVLTVNGRHAGTLGSPGEVRTIRITTANAATIR